MALFSTLLSSTETTSTSSSIPTIVQLFKSKAIVLDPNVKVAGDHAILTYQAIEVLPWGEEGSALFGHRKSKGNQVVKPNLGVWDARVSVNGENALVDKLLHVPEQTTKFCFTVDLSTPAQVEPAMAAFQATLLRLLIEKPPAAPSDSADRTKMTTLGKLKLTDFGLADEDDKSKEKINQTAPSEAEGKTFFSLMICAMMPNAGPVENTADLYKRTQSQALVVYHLRKYAAALNATLCFIRATEDSQVQQEPEDVEADSEHQQQATMSVAQLSHVWKEWASEITPSRLDDIGAAMYEPGSHQEELIETVLLRNAHCPGQWDASKDSLWTALKPENGDGDDVDKVKREPTGDDVWLTKLRDSVVTDTPTKAPKPQGSANPAASAAAPAASTTPKADAASFFENLLK